MTEKSETSGDLDEKGSKMPQIRSAAKQHRILKEMGIAVLLFIIIGVWMYICMKPSRKHVDAAKARIEAYSHYAILLDGKEVLRFDEDTISLAANFMNSIALWPSCYGKLAAAYNTQLAQNKYLGMQADSIFKEKVDSLDSLNADSRWKVSELTYYIHSHSPQDLGYNRICAYANHETQLRNSSKKLLDSLHHVRKQGDSLHHVNKNIGKMQLVHRIAYRAFYRNEVGKMVSEPCKFMGKLKAHDVYGAHWFQLISKTTPNSVSPISAQLAASLAIAQGSTLRRSIDYTLRPDSLGYYNGPVNAHNQPSGHGWWLGHDGTYYEGTWKNGQRDGWGFSIALKKPLRVGEWKADRYKGERLVYTSDRMYGIDLSKYQHEIGKKKYGIDWSRLRICHLGSISRKTVTGSVDFPIRFIYIKSTEGSSMVNKYYHGDYHQAKAHGFKVGSYHFFSTISPAGTQANHFLKHSNIKRGDLPPVLDVEPMPSQIEKMGGTSVLLARVRTWLRLVQRATGTKPILYVSQTFVNRYLSRAPDLKRDYKIWIARYGEYKPDIHLVYWQLCPDGRVKGIHGEVDINVFNGYKEAFDKFAKNEAVR